MKAALWRECHSGEPPQPVLQGPFVYGRDRLQQLIAKLPPNGSAQLSELADRGQPVQPRHQRVL